MHCDQLEPVLNDKLIALHLCISEGSLAAMLSHDTNTGDTMLNSIFICIYSCRFYNRVPVLSLARLTGWMDHVQTDVTTRPYGPWASNKGLDRHCSKEIVPLPRQLFFVHATTLHVHAATLDVQYSNYGTVRYTYPGLSSEALQLRIGTCFCSRNETVSESEME